MKVFPLLTPGRTYIIAEIGVNHNGDPAMAKQMVDVAVLAGADAVKFQTFNPKKLVSINAKKAAYQISNDTRKETQLEMLERFVLSSESLKDIAKYTRDQGIEFLSTPFDEESAATLNELNVSAFKVSSGDLTTTEFLKTLARYGRPIILSTGMGSLIETAEAVEAIREGGNPPLALLHCVSNYPAEPAEVNLRAIDTLATAFQVPVGWSDHTLGETVAVAAVARGARIVEKHFTLDPNLPGPDHKASLTPEELTSYILAIRTVEIALGDGIKKAQSSELETIKAARRSLIANADLKAGQRVRSEDVVILRPGTGLAPKYLPMILGREISKNVDKGEPLNWSDF